MVGMKPIGSPRTSHRWCHVVCTMHGRHEMIKIPATSQFCERAVRAACSLPEWHVAAIAVTPEHVRLLARVPKRLSREAVIRTVQREAGSVLRRITTLPSPNGRLWGDRAWCFVLSNGVSVEAVRRHISGGAPPTAEPSGSVGAGLFSEGLEL